MENYKLKIALGENVFEAEGPADVVQAQFAAFRELIEQMKSAPPPAPPSPLPDPGPTPGAAPTLKGELMLDKIMRNEGRIVSLTVRGASLEDEIILILLGQRKLRTNDSVSGAELLDGLRLTGRTVGRIDYQLSKMTDAGDVITVGRGRASRYRLTNQGFAKAQDLATDLVTTVV
jgi:hypothetical protein